MRRTIVGLTLIGLLPTSVEAQAPRQMYVQTDAAEMMPGPAATTRVNRVYRQQAVTVFEVRNGWGRVTEPGYTQRWIEMRLLGPARPADMPVVQSPLIFSDARIESGAVATRPGGALSARDIEMLWRAARRALDTGCGKIINSDRSVSRRDTYYIACSGEPRNRFYTVSQLTRN
ncbi:hypothetical protein ACVFYP_22160 [Roseomonas sp. F4]